MCTEEVRYQGGDCCKRFRDYGDAVNPYMFHCHILEHEDVGMMGQFVVEVTP